MRRTLNKTLKRSGLVVVEEELSKKTWLGCWDNKLLKISIKPDQAWVSKNITLIHELLHVCDTAVVNAKVRPVCISHKWIEQTAWTLLHLLVELDLYKGVSKKELRAFFAKAVATSKREKKKKSGRKRNTRK